MTDLMVMYGFTYEQWMDPERLRKRAQEEWDKFHAEEAAFRAVQNKDHWKGPIDAVIEADMMNVTYAAVGNRSGYDKLKMERLPDGRVRVTSPGYWANGY